MKEYCQHRGTKYDPGAQCGNRARWQTGTSAGGMMARYMNDYEIERALQRYAWHPILGPAAATLSSLAEWTNTHSDGWAHWPKPCRAAARLMEMIERDGTAAYVFDAERKDVTAAEYRKALAPIGAFRTCQGADFEIVEATT